MESKREQVYKLDKHFHLDPKNLKILLISIKEVNKTIINKYADSEPMATINGGSANLSQEAFMATMEQDAKERYKRKQESKKIANELKEKGNEQFKQGNLDEALKYYTEVKFLYLSSMALIRRNQYEYNTFLGAHTHKRQHANLHESSSSVHQTSQISGSDQRLRLGSASRREVCEGSHSQGQSLHLYERVRQGVGAVRERQECRAKADDFS